MSDIELRCEVAELRREIRDLSLIVIRGFRNLGESMSTQFATLDEAVTGLTSSVEGETTVESGLVTLTSQLFAAYQTALQNAGATQAQLAALSGVNDKVQANIAALSAAVTANTPVATPPAPAPTDPSAPTA